MATQTRHAKRAEAQAHQHALSLAAQNAAGAAVVQDIVISEHGSGGNLDGEIAPPQNLKLKEPAKPVEKI